MLDNFGLIFGVVCLLLGAVLLYDGFSVQESIQSLNVIVGATLLSLGTIAIVLVVRSKLEWNRNYKKWRE
jgi:uncharacterized membrane protein HdeD (DUF308 family)